MTTAGTDVAARFDALQAELAAGRILEAFEAFYADDVSMQENTEAPMVGHAANLERERAFVGSIGAFGGYEVLASAVRGDTSFVESEMRFTAADGSAVVLRQCARQRWRDGRIVDEVFYHG